jgi:hypothetical protein
VPRLGVPYAVVEKFGVATLKPTLLIASTTGFRKAAARSEVIFGSSIDVLKL